MNLSPDNLQAPIPGMSLTQPPREMPFENPPELSELPDVIEYYSKKLLDTEIEDSLLMTIDEGASVDAIAEFLITSGTMNSIHSLDLAFLVSPVVKELIMYVADSAGVDFIDSYEAREKNKRLPYREIRSVVKEVFNERPDLADPTDPIITKSIPKGLMARAPEEEVMDMPVDMPQENI